MSIEIREPYITVDLKHSRRLLCDPRTHEPFAALLQTLSTTQWDSVSELRLVDETDVREVEDELACLRVDLFAVAMCLAEGRHEDALQAVREALKPREEPKP